MANLALVTADRVRVEESLEQMTLSCAEDIAAGAPVRVVPTGTGLGEFTNANGTTATEVAAYGVASHSVKAGGALTAIRKGVIDGYVLDALDYWAPVYISDTDGRLSTAIGDSTVDVIVGRVIPAQANYLGTNPDKLLLVDFPL